MDIALDPERWLRGPASLRQGGATDGQIDWYGLAARLAASHAIHQALTAREGTTYPPAGSFDPAAAQILAGYRGDRAATVRSTREPGANFSTRVNPTALAVLKATSGNDGLPPPALEV